MDWVLELRGAADAVRTIADAKAEIRRLAFALDEDRRDGERLLAKHAEQSDGLPGDGLLAQAMRESSWTKP